MCFMTNRESVASRNAVEIAQRLAVPFAEREAAHDERGTFPHDNVRDVIDSGLLTLNVPSSHGGLGASLSQSLDVLRTLAHGSPSTALMMAMHTAVLAHYLLDPELVPPSQRDAFERQREWAWKEAGAGKIFAVANSEPGAGGDVHNSRARVGFDGQQLTLSGLKSFASFGTNADYYMAAARDERDRVEYYVVRNDGVSVQQQGEWDALGMRSSESIVLRFENAPVVGVLGYAGLLDGVNLRHWSTLGFTAVTVGIAESLFEDVRRSGDALLQRVEAVEFHLLLQSCRSFLQHLALTAPPISNRTYKQQVRDCKLFVTRSLAKQGSALFVAQTGRAYQRNSPISRKLRDLLAGPALRPPVGITFEEVWTEISI
jgi:alkylation response protein AidB-like acyl-CoA dehydrogenase